MCKYTIPKTQIYLLHESGCLWDNLKTSFKPEHAKYNKIVSSVSHYQKISLSHGWCRCASVSVRSTCTFSNRWKPDWNRFARATGKDMNDHRIYISDVTNAHDWGTGGYDPTLWRLNWPLLKFQVSGCSQKGYWKRSSTC